MPATRKSVSSKTSRHQILIQIVAHFSPRLSRYTRSGPPCQTRRRGRYPRPQRVSPDYPHHPSNVPCPLPRRIERVRVSIASPPVLLSPLFRRVSIRIITFEACSGFTLVTARWIAQPPKATPCHEASTRPVTRYSRSSATRPIDNYLGGTFLHWCYAPSGALNKTG